MPAPQLRITVINQATDTLIHTLIIRSDIVQAMADDNWDESCDWAIDDVKEMIWSAAHDTNDDDN